MLSVLVWLSSLCSQRWHRARLLGQLVSFNQLNKETGNRIRYRKIDPETGDEVPQENIIKGYEVAKGEYIELNPEELEAVGPQLASSNVRHRQRYGWLEGERALLQSEGNEI
jgi:hypothetical protein